MRLTSSTILTLTSLTGVAGFAGPLAQYRRTAAVHVAPLNGIRCENKYYQLEELEDKESCTTELFLTANGQVEFGETDGPVFAEAIGTWQVMPGTDDFTMTLIRKFKTGQSKTDMGEFDYEIGRVYKGEMTKVGDSVGITGTMNSLPDALTGEQQVGFFNMIDGTDIREDRRPDARMGVQRSS